MKGEKLYDLLDRLDDSLVMESAEVKRRTWRFRLGVLLSLLLILAVVVFATTYPVVHLKHHPPDNLGGEPGILRNGVYYVYAGDGLHLPFAGAEVYYPRGIYAYTPGQGPELLVDAQERTPAGLMASWDVNSHSLFYVDQNRSSLWRVDLKTKEETLFYSCVEQVTEDGSLAQVLLGMLKKERTTEDLLRWSEAKNAEATVWLYLEHLTEDEVVFEVYDSVTEEGELFTLDARTGERKENGDDWVKGQGTLFLGDRVLQLVPMDYPEDFDYPNRKQVERYDMDHWTDIREGGVSVLPPGPMETVDWHELGDGLLISYLAFKKTPNKKGEHETEDRFRSLLLTSDGRQYTEEEEPPGDLLWVTGRWAYYICSNVPIEGSTLTTNDLMVRDLETGEDYLVMHRFRTLSAVADGSWFYSCRGGNDGGTDCYRIDYDEEGIPCGLTLIEENI